MDHQFNDQTQYRVLEIAAESAQISLYPVLTSDRQRFSILPDEQEKAYRHVFKILLEKNPGVKVVILSPSPSHVGTFEAYDKKFSPQTQIYMFGKKEFLDAYDAVSRKLAKEYGFDHIDMLNIMRNTPDMRSLYVEDAVHLTPRGGMIVARGILQYFAQKFPVGK